MPSDNFYSNTKIAVTFNTEGADRFRQSRMPLLARLWEQAEAVRRDKDGMFVYLRVRSEGAPVSLSRNANESWLASYSRLSAGEWEVGLWLDQLRMQVSYPIRPEIAGVTSVILKQALNLSADTWQQVERPLMPRPSYGGLMGPLFSAPV